jgi:hypothetical protein
MIFYFEAIGDKADCVSVSYGAWPWKEETSASDKVCVGHRIN